MRRSRTYSRSILPSQRQLVARCSSIAFYTATVASISALGVVISFDSSQVRLELEHSCAISSFVGSSSAYGLSLAGPRVITSSCPCYCWRSRHVLSSHASA